MCALQLYPMLVEIEANCIDLVFFDSSSGDMISKIPEENQPTNPTKKANIEGEDYVDSLTNIEEGEGAN